MKAKLAVLAIMGAMCEASLPYQMRIKPREAPKPIAYNEEKIRQAEAKRARKAQIRRGQK